MHRNTKEVSLILVIAMLFSIAGCAKKQKVTEVEISSSETTIVETTSKSSKETTVEISSTTEETTSQNTTVIEESEQTVTESTESESSESSSATPETTKESEKPKATATPKPTKTPSTPTPAPTATPVPTDTPIPTPTSAPKAKDPGLRKSTAISAAKAAVQDKCGSHEGFEFNETVMANEQARAKYCADNQTFYGHTNFPSSFSSFIPLEAAASLTGYIFEDGSELYSWTDHSGVEYTYDNLYDCVYACAADGVTNHTTKLSSDSANKYYGIGFDGYKDQWTEDEYGIITYMYFLYIGADDDISRNSRGY